MIQVETYEMETASGALFATDEERDQLVKLASELALTGQQEIMATPTGEIFPYRLMTVQEQNIYGTLLPQHTKVAEFKDSVFPLRVMQIIAHARALNDKRLAHLEVWHEPTFKDPVLVGRETYYSSQMFILARWGEELESLGKLRSRAAAKLVPKAKAWAKLAAARIAAFAADPDLQVHKYLDGEDPEWKLSGYTINSL